MSSPFQYLLLCLELCTAPSVPDQFLLSIFVALPPILLNVILCHVPSVVIVCRITVGKLSKIKALVAEQY
jgi:hypothetical protein